MLTTLSPRLAAPLLDTRLGGGALSPTRDAVLTDVAAFTTGDEDVFAEEEVLAAADVLEAPFEAAEEALDEPFDATELVLLLLPLSSSRIMYPFRA